eukprot:TRINITY_DN95981_c0_g1_i1.p1 TRINITY_DN95981_c0_g1~~TRINITY_DN95981_c0_g1_i1.p1  ORF type:complete len:215 (+),score=21.79 TRINITY_DN95981_c0_g1_i1:86-730(+)
MSTATYGKVSQQEDSGLRSRVAVARPVEDDSHLSERDRQKKKWVDRLNWVWTKVSAAFWVAAASFIIWYTNFFLVMWESPLVNKTYFYLAWSCLAFNMSMLGYFVLWCDLVKGIKEPWEKHQKALPVMGLVGFLTYFFFIFAFWRVWGIFTAVMQIVFFLGYINAGQFLPSGHLGSILLFLVFFAAFLSPKYIEHEGFAHYTPRPSELTSTVPP